MARILGVAIIAATLLMTCAFMAQSRAQPLFFEQAEVMATHAV